MKAARKKDQKEQNGRCLLFFTWSLKLWQISKIRITALKRFMIYSHRNYAAERNPAKTLGIMVVLSLLTVSGSCRIYIINSMSRNSLIFLALSALQPAKKHQGPCAGSGRCCDTRMACGCRGGEPWSQTSCVSHTPVVTYVQIRVYLYLFVCSAMYAHIYIYVCIHLHHIHHIMLIYNIYTYRERERERERWRWRWASERLAFMSVSSLQPVKVPRSI